MEGITFLCSPFLYRDTLWVLQLLGEGGFWFGETSEMLRVLDLLLIEMVVEFFQLSMQTRSVHF